MSKYDYYKNKETGSTLALCGEYDDSESSWIHARLRDMKTGETYYQSYETFDDIYVKMDTYRI